jgi:magnesium-transporting ATPase (P-type)
MNVMFISLGVNFAKGLEKSLAPHEKSPAMHDPRVSLLTAQRGKLGKVMTAISMSLVLQRAGTNTSGNDADDNAEGSGTVAGRSIISSVLRRPPFIPNFETNVVFLLSILQSAVVSLLNHRGKPFQQSIFENRAVCWNFCAAVLFYFLGVSGIVPLLTTELEIKPFPTRQSKIGMIFIGLLNVLGCLVCRVISDRIYLREIDHHTQSNPMNARPIVPRNWKRSTSSPTLQFAADYEENLLEEESQSNVSGVKLFTVLMLLLMWDLVRN